MSDGSSPSSPQHQGPPPGYGGFPPASSPFGSSPAGVSLWLALASIAGMALAVTLEEDGDNDWGRIGVWAAFAIAAAALTLVPVVGRSMNLSQDTAWKVGAGGAVGLVAFWVLFVLPSISMNVSFLATVAVVAGAAAVWSADGRPDLDGGGSGPATW